MPEAPRTVLHVALPVPLPREFDYLPPPDAGPPATDWIGRRLRVPFGRSEQIGVIAGIGPPAETGPELKVALALLDPAPVLGGELLASLRWLAQYTHAPLGEVLATALPALLRAGQPAPETRAYAWTLATGADPGRLRANTRPRRLAELLAAGPVSEDRLDIVFEDWRSAARALAKRDIAERIPLLAPEPVHDDPSAPVLNNEQAAALAALRAGQGFRALLLEGVTGSGKTEVYLQAIRDCLQAGKQALVLVPEIGLTPQTLARFRARLGVPVHAHAFGLGRRRACARLDRDGARRSPRAGRHALGDLHAAAGSRPDRHRRRTRRQLQAAGRHSLPRPRFRPGARARRWRSRSCLAARRRRWNRCTTPSPAATRTCAWPSVPAAPRPRACACSTCASAC